MRTTIDLPDSLFRRAKSTAALRGTSLKDLLVVAVEKELAAPEAEPGRTPPRRMRLPLVRLKGKRRLELGGVNFDDLLA